MKIKLLFLLLLIGTGLSAQNVPSYVPSNGLVGWWPFNGNANDESGNGNNGTVNGATLTGDRFGNGNSAYEFDGIDDAIEMGQLPNSNFSSDSSFAYSIWVNPNGLQFGRIFSFTNLAGDLSFVHQFTYEQPDVFSFNCAQNTGTVNPPYAQATTTSFAPNQWAHIVLIYSAGNLSVHINGSLVVTASYSGPQALEAIISELRLGYIPNEPLERFSGTIDDIGIWNRALNQQEITNLYNAMLPSTSIPIFSCPGAFMSPNLTNGLVGWWPFCGDAEDESGNGNNGTVNGATLTSDRFGNANSAYEFDSNYISTNYPGILADSARSISFWYNLNQNNTSSDQWTMVSYGGTGQPCGRFSCNIWPGSNNPTIDLDFTYASYSATSIIGSWKFYCITYDPNDGSNVLAPKIYIDGVLQNNIATSFNTSCILNTGSNFSLRFGGNSNPLAYFRGKLDDIGIWSRALDSLEVIQLYNTGICQQTISGSCDTLIFNANITGFNPITYANQVKVYPNPASDNLVIDCGSNFSGLNGYSIQITNTLGQTVYNSSITTQVTNIQLNSPTWVNGTYVVQFINPQGTVLDTKRIIVQ